MSKNINLKGQITIMKELGIKPNFALLSSEMGVDWRTAKKYYESHDPKKVTRNKKSKLDPFQEEIKDKLKINRTTVNGAYNFFIKKYGTNSIGGYSNFVTYVKNNHLLPKKSKSKGHPRCETPIGKQIQVDWKDYLNDLLTKYNDLIIIDELQGFEESIEVETLNFTAFAAVRVYNLDECLGNSIHVKIFANLGEILKNIIDISSELEYVLDGSIICPYLIIEQDKNVLQIKYI